MCVCTLHTHTHTHTHPHTHTHKYIFIHIYIYIVTTPPLLVAGRATCPCITDAPQVWPARSLLGTPGSATIRAPPTDLMGDSERERSRGNLAPYCSSWAMIIAPYLLRYNIPSTALACIHTLQPY